MAAIPSGLERGPELPEAGAAFTLAFHVPRGFCALVMALAGTVAFPTQPAIGVSLWLTGAAIFAL